MKIFISQSVILLSLNDLRIFCCIKNIWSHWWKFTKLVNHEKKNKKASILLLHSFRYSQSIIYPKIVLWCNYLRKIACRFSNVSTALWKAIWMVKTWASLFFIFAFLLIFTFYGWEIREFFILNAIFLFLQVHVGQWFLTLPWKAFITWVI